jgi:hypothetical protein
MPLAPGEKKLQGKINVTTVVAVWGIIKLNGN